MAMFSVDILGCGSATPTVRHTPACQVVDFRDRLMMVDCGEGAQLQFRRMKLKFSRLGHIFISHLHGDHFLGLPGLLSTLALHDTGGTVTIHTFAEGADILRKIMAVFCRDTSFEIEYDIIEPAKAVIYEDKAMTVETFPLYHRVPTVGYIFREKPSLPHIRGEMVKFLNIPVSRIPAIKAGEGFEDTNGRQWRHEELTTPAAEPMSYAYCSDTMYDTRVAEAVKGVNTIYHEATYLADSLHKAAPRGHSTAAQAGEIATLAGAKRLILGHYSQAYDNDALFAAEAATTFSGEIIAATEGMKIDLLK